MRILFGFMALLIVASAALIAGDVLGYFDVETEHFFASAMIAGVAAVFLALVSASRLPAMTATAAVVMIGLLSLAPFGLFGFLATSNTTQAPSQPLQACTLDNAINLNDASLHPGVDRRSRPRWDGSSWSGVTVPAQMGSTILQCLKWDLKSPGYFVVTADTVAGNNGDLALDAIDPALKILRPDDSAWGSETVAEDDDGGEDVNARIEAYLDAGVYIIQVEAVENPQRPDRIVVGIRNESAKFASVPEIAIDGPSLSAALSPAGAENGEAWAKVFVPQNPALPDGSPACVAVETLPPEPNRQDTAVEFFRSVSSDSALFPTDRLARNDDRLIPPSAIVPPWRAGASGLDYEMPGDLSSFAAVRGETIADGGEWLLAKVELFGPSAELEPVSLRAVLVKRAPTGATAPASPRFGPRGEIDEPPAEAYLGYLKRLNRACIDPKIEALIAKAGNQTPAAGADADPAN